MGANVSSRTISVWERRISTPSTFRHSSSNASRSTCTMPAFVLRTKPSRLWVMVVTLRTFYKLYGLAGLRVGYGVMPAELAGYLNRIRQPFNVNSFALAAALAALADGAESPPAQPVEWVTLRDDLRRFVRHAQ